MEREVILTSNNSSEKNKIAKEVQNIKTLLPYIESFETFSECSEILDLSAEKVIKKKKKLLEVYERGTGNNAFLFLFVRN